ncbi:cell division ATP-binding protein FtsE [Naasia lichenicola]|uniref:Cell division ATP-binding protein FtsE n=1 Tax=Naasia lichenicola TaxID=2565933 RepID=A0A4S4FFU8_9MICO|nr:cell division ATP-binding protein FtsE [Naasia lichenicola]
MIRFDRVTKLYPGNSKPALNGVDVEIQAGEFVFLVGASGSGKSSFLRLVLKEERPSSGEIHVLGQRLSAISNRKIPYFRRSLGVVFQDFRLLPGRTVYQNVAFTLQVIGKSRGFIQEAVPDVLEMVGLGGKFERLPHELSGGEQQRVAIARAVVNKPAILLADEPTGNLDPTTSQGIMQVLAQINASGTTVVMATHDVGIVDQMKRRVIELIGGDIIRDEVEGGYTTSLDLPVVAAAGASAATASTPSGAMATGPVPSYAAASASVAASADPLGRLFTGPVELAPAAARRQPDAYPGTQPVFVRTDSVVEPVAAPTPTAASGSWSLADDLAEDSAEDSAGEAADRGSHQGARDGSSSEHQSITDHRLQSGHVEIVQSMFAAETAAPNPAPTSVPAATAAALGEPHAAEAPILASADHHAQPAASATSLFESTLASTPLFASTTAEHPAYFAATGAQPIIPSASQPQAPRYDVARTESPRTESAPTESAPIESPRTESPRSHSPRYDALRSRTSEYQASREQTPTEPVAHAAAAPHASPFSVSMPPAVESTPPASAPAASTADTAASSSPSTQPAPMVFGVSPAWPATTPLVSATPQRFPVVEPMSPLPASGGSAGGVSTEPVPVISRAPSLQGSTATMTGSFPRLPVQRTEPSSSPASQPASATVTGPIAPVAASAAAPAAAPVPAPVSAAAASTAPVPTMGDHGPASPGRHPLSAALAAQRNLPLPPLPVPSNRPAAPESASPQDRLSRMVDDDDDALALAVRLGLRRPDAHPQQTSGQEVGPTA